MYECRERCVRAVQSKDARFDGWFFTAVLTTKIYCRPSCPVVPPKVENMRVLPERRSRAAGWVPRLQAVPSGCEPGFAGVERSCRPGRARDAVDQRRRGRPRRRTGSCYPTRVQRPPGAAATPGRAGSRSACTRPGSAGPDRAAVDRDEPAADGRCRFRCRVFERPDVQRDCAGSLRALADRASPSRQEGDESDRARHDLAALAVPCATDA